MSGLWREGTAGWQAIGMFEPVPGSSDLPGVDGVAFCSFGHGSERGVALLVRPGILARVNGQPILGGMRVLTHRDEVLLGSIRFYYSAQRTPCVVVFRSAEGARAPVCPVCRGPIVQNGSAVQCPGCGRWYHQSEPSGRQCWTYSGSCRFCEHPTSLTGETIWRPEMEETNALRAPGSGRP